MRRTLSVSLVCIGKLRDGAMKELAQMYESRVDRYARFNVLEVPHSKVTSRKGSSYTQVAKNFEGANLRVALDVRGKTITSPGFAKVIQKAEDSGQSLSFLIGGPEGIPEELSKVATMRLSLSPCTFPHELFRVIFLEQLYRAFTIMRGEPYHKE